MGDGASPEVFSIVCGVTDVTINETANTSDRFRRDCAKPGVPGIRYTKSGGKQLEVTGSGTSHADMTVKLMAAVGAVRNYKIEARQKDGTDTGELLGTYAGAFRMTAHNITTAAEGEGSVEITLANHGAYTYTPAP
jgi:hypothetical protein